MSLMDQFKRAKLYCVTPTLPSGKVDCRMVEEALLGGADIVQLREKSLSSQDLHTLARELRNLCHKYGALFIVNDFLDVAIESLADGVHLGQEDMSISQAKKRVGERVFLIGCSTHSLDQALRAEKDGADYIACGPIYSTPTKPGREAVGEELVKEYSKAVQTPFVAIGGIDSENVEQVLRAGAKRVAVVRAVFGATNIKEAARNLKEKIKSYVS